LNTQAAIDVHGLLNAILLSLVVVFLICDQHSDQCLSQWVLNDLCDGLKFGVLPNLSNNLFLRNVNGLAFFHLCVTLEFFCCIHDSLASFFVRFVGLLQLLQVVVVQCEESLWLVILEAFLDNALHRRHIVGLGVSSQVEYWKIFAIYSGWCVEISCLFSFKSLCKDLFVRFRQITFSSRLRVVELVDYFRDVDLRWVLLDLLCQ